MSFCKHDFFILFFFYLDSYNVSLILMYIKKHIAINSEWLVLHEVNWIHKLCKQKYNQIQKYKYLLIQKIVFHTKIIVVTYCEKTSTIFTKKISYLSLYEWILDRLKCLYISSTRKIFVHPWLLNILTHFLELNNQRMQDFSYVIKYKKKEYKT